MPEPKKLGPYPYYVLALLFVGTLLNYYDRNVISIILQPMKTELHLTNSQAGLLSGLAFAVVYSLLGIPIARFADRGRRVVVLSTALAVWSIMTAACGLATGYLSMFIARLGVGVGEAGGSPTTHALVAEYFPVDRRARAFSAIAVGGVMGGLLGLMIGGLITASFGWRAAFWFGGAPGLATALLVFLTVREPNRDVVATGRPATAAVTTEPQLSTRAALGRLAGRRSFVWMILGFTVASTGAYAALAWSPTFFMRSFGISVAKIGLIYSVITALPALIGMLAGGIVVDRWIRKDLNAYVWLMAITFGLALPLSVVTYASHNLSFVLAVTVASSLVSSIYIGPMYAMTQALAGPKLRATASAVLVMATSLVSLSIGPWAAGYLSDLLQPRFGQESLRWALCALSVTYAVSVVFFLLALKTFKADVAEAERS